MLGLGQLRRILCIGAHCDDIEIGCGATLLGLARRYPEADVRWIVLSSNDVREAEARAAATEFTAGFASLEISIETFRNGYFPQVSMDVKDYFEGLKTEPEPDLIFTHYHADSHQDHRIACELTWNTFRGHTILEYEVPKWDPDMGNPGILFPASEDIARRKAALISKYFVSQRSKTWFDEETFLSLMRLRGVNAATRYAEGFHAPKLVVSAF